MNARFGFIAGILTGVTASALLYYFVLRSPAALDHGVAAAEVARAAGASAAPASKAPSMEEATARLQARLERDGGSADDWELLAKSYDFLGRPEAAASARQHTTTAAAAKADDRMPSPAAVAATLSAAGGPVAGAEIYGTVSIEGSLASRVDRDAVLFIYAKAVDAPGPPLAVLRLSANSWPVKFRLDDSQAMLPSRRLSQFQNVIVEARISRSGQATPAKGDLYVTSNAVSPGSGKKLALVINHEIG